MLRSATVALLCSGLAAAEGQTAAPGISIHLAGPRAPIEVGATPTFSATLTNVSRHRITIVLPGDGSEVGWRTPLVGWASRAEGDDAPFPVAVPLVQLGNGVMRCGYMNELKREEIVELAPGAQVALGEWIDAPALARPGAYRVRFYYGNDPQHPWKNRDAEGTPAVMAALHASTACFAISDEATVVVVAKDEPPPAGK